MKKYALLLVVAGLGWGQSLTTVTDTLYTATGTYCSGTLTLAWSTFTAPDGHLVYGGSWETPIPATLHNLSVTIEPGQYTASYNITPTGCAPAYEQWIVPSSGSPLTLAAVRSILAPVPYSLLSPTWFAQDGATPGETLCWSGSQWIPGNCALGGLVFPLTLGQGGTGGTTSAAGLANLLSGNSQGDNTNKVQMAGAVSGVPGTPLCIDVLGNDTTSGCTVAGSMAWPAGGSGVPLYNGSSGWGATYTVGAAANNLVQLNGSDQLPAVSGALITGVQASTAAALASLPTLCSAGQAPTGILSSGNSTGCTAYQAPITGAPGTWPIGTQTQFLQIAPNTGNNTTLRMVSLPTVQASDYAFTPQAPGGSLSIGSNAITLSPVPLGVNGSDASHPLYISGGTGAPEAVLITGGTAVSGASTGTVIVTCANTHSGLWTLASAFGGVQEAINSLGPSGGTVQVPPGTITVYAGLTVPSNTILNGSGANSTKFLLADGAWPSTEAGPFYFVNSATPEVSVIHSADGATDVLMQNFTLDMNGTNNPNNANGDDIFLVNCVDCTVRTVSIVNGHHQGAASAGIGVNGSNDVWDNVTVHMGGVAPCEGGILTTILHSQVVHSYADGLCDAAFIANGAWSTSHDMLFDDDQVESNLAAAFAGGFGVEGASNVTFSNSSCKGPYNEGCYYVINAGANVSNIQFIGNSSGPNSAGTAVSAVNVSTSSTNTIQNVSLLGGNYQGNNYGFSMGVGAGGAISNVSVIGATFTGGISATNRHRSDGGEYADRG